MPRVSVVIPTYNRAGLVQEAIDSVLAQLFQDVELIVVDDGSEDDTASILQERYGSAIRLVVQENQGESGARNRGIRESTGEYVAFLDSDDMWLPGKLSRQIDVLDRWPDIGLISCQAYWMRDDGRRLKMKPQGHSTAAGSISWRELAMGNCVAGGGSAAVARSSVLEQVGIFDTSLNFGADWDLWLRIARNHRVYQIEEPLILYRINPQGTRTASPRTDDIHQLFERFYAIIDKALEQCPLGREECQKIGDLAQGHMLLRQAIMSLCVGHIDQGVRCWRQVHEGSIFYIPHSAEVVDLINSAVSGYAMLDWGLDGVSAARRMVDQILAGLASCTHEMRLDRDRVLGGVYAELAHRSAANEDIRMARRYSLTAFRYQPRLIRNIGLAKILMTGGRHLWPDHAVHIAER